MPNYASKWTNNDGNGNTVTADGAGEVIRNVYEINFAEAPFRGVTLLTNDLIDIGILPANHTIADIFIDTDDIDTNGTPLMSVDVGMMSGTPGDTVSVRTVGQEFFAGDTTVRTGGLARTTRSSAMRVAPTGADRSFGVKIVAQAATQASTTSGRFRLIIDMIG
jgi:hypothetical protein